MFSPVKVFIDGYTNKIKIVNTFKDRTIYYKPNIVNLFLRHGKSIALVVATLRENVFTLGQLLIVLIRHSIYHACLLLYLV